ncbi:Uncharacterized protein GBIM_17530 [Gryllus bimaculatus]|nr:Uncharacterized protein GBIM_17530 [Gryllus bimaculatus]
MFGKRRRMHKKKVGKKLRMEKMLNRLKKKEAENNMILKKEESFAISNESSECVIDCNLSVGECIESTSSSVRENDENLDPLEMPFLLETEKKKNEFSPQKRPIKRTRVDANVSARRSGRKWPVRNGTSNLVSWLNAAEEIFDSPERQSKRSFDSPLTVHEDLGPIRQPKKRAKSAHEILHFHPSDFEEPMDISPASIISTPGALAKNKRSRKVALGSSLTFHERSCFGEDAPVDSQPKKRAKSVSADVWDLHNKCTPSTSSNDAGLQANCMQSAIPQDVISTQQEEKDKMNKDLPCIKSVEGIVSGCVYKKLPEAATQCNTVQVSASAPLTSVDSIQKEIPMSSSLEIPCSSKLENSVCVSTMIMPPDEGVACREKGMLSTKEQVECVINRTDDPTLELLTTTEQKLLFPMQDVPSLLSECIKSTLKESEVLGLRVDKPAVESNASEIKKTSAPDPFTELLASEKCSPLMSFNSLSVVPVKDQNENLSSSMATGTENKNMLLRSQNVSLLSSTPVGDVPHDNSFKPSTNRKLPGDLDFIVVPDQGDVQENEHATSSKSDPSNKVRN